LVGPSRKHFLAAQYPEAGGDRDRATALFCAEAAAAGARILRVHALAFRGGGLLECIGVGGNAPPANERRTP
ncbi:MAG: dihydropteroate synthase, partial [Kiritimatiellae bacterium]|nr:dihydropteroate synthase [Kiritimatiellia bacterium]